jgi:hypothetical protein
MNQIPTDSMLRRHYLTEMKNRNDGSYETHEYDTPLWSNVVMIPAILFLFFMGVIFL